MPTTVIVGAGAAGLAAAYTLENAGAECLVLEKADYIGGRLHGKVREGFTLDLGAQFFMRRYRDTFELIKKLGLKNQVARFKWPVGVPRDGTMHVVRPEIADSLRHPILAHRSSRLLSLRARPQGFRFLFELISHRKDLDFNNPEKAIELDSISFADYAKERIGDEFLEYIFAPATLCLTLSEPEEVSAAYGLGLFRYFMSGLSTLEKGIGFLADALAENISDIRLNSEVSRIVLEGKRVKGVEVVSGHGKEFLEAENVICATTATTASRLLSELPVSMTGILAGVTYSACTHVMFAIGENLMGEKYAIGLPRSEDYCIAGIMENTNKAKEYAPPGKGLMHALTHGRHARRMLEENDSEVCARVIRDVQKLVPGFPDNPLFSEVFRWPEAVNISGPGQIRSVRDVSGALKEYRGLHLAGEYTGMPSIESAIHSGVKAADKILHR